MQGDLAKKKIFPTLWWLFRDKLLPKHIFIIGYARSDLTPEKLRESYEKHCKVRDSEKSQFDDYVKRISYVSGQYDKDEGFEKLNAAMKTMEEKLKSR